MFIRTERSIREFIHFYPVVTIILIINITLWLLTNVSSTSLGHVIYSFGVGHNISIYVNGEYWRLLTPVFLHANLGHVLFNSFALVLFGPALERMTGKVPFAVIYLLTGIAGNIGTYIVSPQSQIPHLGASGAIYGLFGVYIYMTIKRKDLIDAQSAQIVRTIFIIGLILTFIRPNINIPAHLFGFIGGLIVAPFLLKTARPFRRPQFTPRTRDDGVAFDPNRWNKRRYLSPKARKNVMWGIFIIIFIFLLLVDYK